MQKHYLIFDRPVDSHTYLMLVRGENVEAAIRRYLREESRDVLFLHDGSVEFEYREKVMSYPHVMAYIEAVYKCRGEWQIRELADDVWARDYEESLFVGENPHDIKAYIRAALPYFHKQHSLTRPRAFVWYLVSGPLVTFYRRAGHFRIDVLARYVVRSPSRQELIEWSGSYAELLEQLLLQPASLERQVG
jgi:hypothetical protein